MPTDLNTLDRCKNTPGALVSPFGECLICAAEQGEVCRNHWTFDRALALKGDSDD